MGDSEFNFNECVIAFSLKLIRKIDFTVKFAFNNHCWAVWLYVIIMIKAFCFIGKVMQFSHWLLYESKKSSLRPYHSSIIVWTGGQIAVESGFIMLFTP